jgi:hypothetical protein
MYSSNSVTMSSVSLQRWILIVRSKTVTLWPVTPKTQMSLVSTPFFFTSPHMWRTHKHRYCIVLLCWGGTMFCGPVTANGPIVSEYDASMELYCQGKPEELGQKPVPVSLVHNAPKTDWPGSRGNACGLNSLLFHMHEYYTLFGDTAVWAMGCNDSVCGGTHSL